MTANVPADDAKQQNQQQTVSHTKGQDFEKFLLNVLEISPYDLAVLKRYLIATQVVPDTTDEDAIEDAVYRFRTSYDGPDRPKFGHNLRLNRLFEVWNDKDVEGWEELDEDRYPPDTFSLVLDRETAKYNAVRSLIAHLAAHNKLKNREPATRPNDQSM